MGRSEGAPEGEGRRGWAGWVGEETEWEEEGLGGVSRDLKVRG